MDQYVLLLHPQKALLLSDGNSGVRSIKTTLPLCGKRFAP
jgi:hypothetical protein